MHLEELGFHKGTFESLLQHRGSQQRSGQGEFNREVLAVMMGVQGKHGDGAWSLLGAT